MAKSISGKPSGQRVGGAARYEQRLILFIDFLGFKDVVATTAGGRARLLELVEALDELGGIRDLTSGTGQMVTQFSDSVVVSFPVTETSAVFWLLNAVAGKVISLVQRGFLLRGAVTIGKLLHTDRHVLGPAMVEAYEMESKVARYPRVIVDRKVLEAARRYRQPGHSPDDEEGYVRGFLTRDEDGHLFIDYTSWKLVVEIAGLPDEHYPDHLQVLGGLVRKGLGESDPSILRKYLWLHGRYLQALEMISATPEDSPHRLADPDYHDAIAALPRLRRKAAAALAIVEKADRQARRATRRPPSAERG